MEIQQECTSKLDKAATGCSTPASTEIKPKSSKSTSPTLRSTTMWEPDRHLNVKFTNWKKLVTNTAAGIRECSKDPWHIVYLLGFWYPERIDVRGFGASWLGGRRVHALLRGRVRSREGNANQWEFAPRERRVPGRDLGRKFQAGAVLRSLLLLPVLPFTPGLT